MHAYQQITEKDGILMSLELLHVFQSNDTIPGLMVYGGGECVKMTNLPPHADPSKHIDGVKCYIRQTKGYRRVPGDTCVGGNQWDPLEIPCPAGLSSYGMYIIILFCAIALYFTWGFFYNRRKSEKAIFYESDGEGCWDRIKNWIPKWKKGYKLIPVDDDVSFFEQDEVGPSALLIDSEAQQRAKDPFSADLEANKKSSKNKNIKNSVQFKGFPTLKQSTRNIRLPSILPPPSGSSV